MNLVDFSFVFMHVQSSYIITYMHISIAGKSPVVWKRLRNGSHVVTVRASCTVDDETWSVEKSFTFHV